jgi:hypothetical protein
VINFKFRLRFRLVLMIKLAKRAFIAELYIRTIETGHCDITVTCGARGALQDRHMAVQKSYVGRPGS